MTITRFAIRRFGDSRKINSQFLLQRDHHAGLCLNAADSRKERQITCPEARWDRHVDLVQTSGA